MIPKSRKTIKKNSEISESSKSSKSSKKETKKQNGGYDRYDIQIDGGGLGTWIRHFKMMRQYNSVIKKVNKANRKLEKFEKPLNDLRKQYELYNNRVEQEMNEFFQGDRLLMIYDFQLDEIQKDPSKKPFEASIKSNISKIKGRLSNLEKKLIVNFHKSDKKTATDLLNTAQKLLPKLNKYDKEYKRLIDFTNKYDNEIQEIEEIDVLSSENTSDGSKGGKSAESIRKKGKLYKKNYEKLRNLKAEKMDELSKTKQEVDNLKSMIDQLKNNITKMKDNKPKQLDKMLEWKKNANEFHKAIETFSSSSMIKDIEYIKTKLNSVIGVYQETANETIKNRVVPKFKLAEENAQKALELIKKIKTDMGRIKENYYARASASELNADLKYLIAGAHRSTDLLLSIRMFLEQYHTESGWKSFFIQSGGAKTPKSQLGNLIFEFAIKDNNSYFKKYLSIKSKNDELNTLGNNFIDDFCKKDGIKIDLKQFFNMYKNESGGKTIMNFGVGYYELQRNQIYKNKISGDEINLEDSPNWGGTGDKSFFIPLNIAGYYVFYPGKTYPTVLSGGTLINLNARHLKKLFIVYKFDNNDKKGKLFFLEPSTGLPILYYKKDRNKCVDDKILISLINPSFGQTPFDNSQIPAMKLAFDMFLDKTNNTGKLRNGKNIIDYKESIEECSGAHMLVKRFFDEYKFERELPRAHSEIVDIFDRHDGNVSNYSNAKTQLGLDINKVLDYINNTTISKKLPILYHRLVSNISNTIPVTPSPDTTPPDSSSTDTSSTGTSANMINISTSTSDNKNQKLEILKKTHKSEIFNMLSKYLSSDKIKTIINHEEDIIKIINKYLQDYSIEGKTNNPSQKLSQISEYIKKLQEIEVGFIKFSADKPIEQGLQGWDLKTTMTADKINTDKSIVLELKDDMSSLYSDKLKNEVNAYRASNVDEYTMNFLKDPDAQYKIASEPDIISYLNKPGVVKKILQPENRTVIIQNPDPTQPPTTKLVLVDKHDILGNIAKMWIKLGEYNGKLNFGNDKEILATIVAAAKAITDKSFYKKEGDKKGDKKGDRRNGDRDRNRDRDRDRDSNRSRNRSRSRRNTRGGGKWTQKI